MTPDLRALPPFESWPVQLWDAELGIRAWYAEPAVFVTQTHCTSVGLAHAQIAGRAMDHVLRRFRAQVELHNGLFVIHDWRSVDVFESEARSYYTNRIANYQRGDQRGAAIAVSANPLVRSMLKLAAIAMPFRTGHTVSFIHDPSPLLAEHNVVPIASNPFRELIRAI